MTKPGCASTKRTPSSSAGSGPTNLQLQAPDVDGFNIFFKNGWLNSYSGEITNEYEETTITLVLTREEAARYRGLWHQPGDCECL